MPAPDPPPSYYQSPARRRRFIGAWIVLCAALGVAAFLAISAWRGGADDRREEALTRCRVPEHVADGDGHPCCNPRQFVWDDICYVRPRPGFDELRRIGPVGGGPEVPYRLRHVQRGVVRDAPLPDPPARPAVLLIGDSHMYGFTDVTQNAAALLELRLRADPGLGTAVVANGSCPYYSLYQYVLRARTLWDLVQPDVLVVVVFTGNDLLELEDVSRPHLDDALVERPFDPAPPAETTSARRLVYNRCKPRRFGELFWQGMNQAIYVYQHPERRPVMLAKARRSFALLQELCAANGAALVVALLPSYDDFVNGALPFADDPTMGPIVAGHANRALRLALADVLAGLDIPHVDLLPVFQEARVADVYAGDFHIWTAGHALVAEALAPPVLDALRARGFGDDGR